MLSSSLIQVSVNAQRSMLLLQISTFRSAELFTIDLQFMVAHCRFFVFHGMALTRCIILKFALFMVGGEFRLPIYC